LSKNNIFYEHDGWWIKARDMYAEHGGVWKRAHAKLVGYEGRWTEVFDNETSDSASTAVLSELSYRGGTPWQGELILTGENLGQVAKPIPSNYYFYPMVRGFVENIENGASLKPMPADAAPVAGSYAGGNAIRFDPALRQYVRVPTDAEGGIDLRGMLGLSTGAAMWLFGLQFCPMSLPPAGQKQTLFYGAAYDRYVSLHVESNGDLVFTWKGASVKRLVLPGQVKVGQWSGCWVRHYPGPPYTLTMKADDGATISTASGVPYFTPNVPEAASALYLARGVSSYSYTTDPQFFKPENVRTGMTIVGPEELYHNTANYYTALGSEVMEPGTGLYYIEVANRNSYDVQIGVADTDVPLTEPLGVIGWACNTINGRMFNHQTGGGTAWKTAIPDNSIIGLLYDSDNGQIELFVNGVSRGRPFAVGTIQVPVTFGISGRANATLGKPFSVKVSVSRTTWVYQNPDAAEVPRSLLPTEDGYDYFNGFVRSFFIRGYDFYRSDVQDSLIDPNFEVSLLWKNLSTGVETKVNYCILKSTDTQITQTVPNLPPGEYDVYLRRSGKDTAKKRFTISPFEWTTEPLAIDFATTPKEEIRRKLIRAHKQWGGKNGGVIHENIIHDQEAGLLRIRACGDLYTGPLRGVDRVGKRTTMATRIGGCFATHHYYGPGSYRVVAKLPIHDGVVTAFWTFHYEEGYPGHPVYNEHIAEGIRRGGNLEDGYYTVRNHEIDIEIPTALKGAPDMEVVSYRNGRFNTWFGENRNWDVSENDPSYWTEYTDDFIDHGVQTNDGQFHEFRFDWHLGDNPRVEFYIDGHLKHIVSTTIPDIPGRFWVGLWFPSATNNHWAGKSANFTEEWMDVKSVTITPFPDENSWARKIGESYPLDVYRDFYD